MAILAIVLVMLPGRTGLATSASDDEQSVGVENVMLGLLATALIEANTITLIGSSVQVGTRSTEHYFPEAGFAMGGLGVLAGGLNLGYSDGDPYNLALGAVVLAMGVANLAISGTYETRRDSYPQHVRVVPAALCDRGGNPVTGVAVQVVGF